MVPALRRVIPLIQEIKSKRISRERMQTGISVIRKTRGYGFLLLVALALLLVYSMPAYWAFTRFTARAGWIVVSGAVGVLIVATAWARAPTFLPSEGVRARLAFAASAYVAVALIQFALTRGEVLSSVFWPFSTLFVGLCAGTPQCGG